MECRERGLDPLTTNLVVADSSRVEKTICLAVSPSLKACGIPGRPRLFEVLEKAREVNAVRLDKAIRARKAVKGEGGRYGFTSASFEALALASYPALELSYIVAPPRSVSRGSNGTPEAVMSMVSHPARKSLSAWFPFPFRY